MSTAHSPQHECPKCHGLHSYSYRYDSFYCERCKEWLTAKCPDPVCIFCSERPDKPVVSAFQPAQHD